MELGQLNEWSNEQLGILKDKAISSFGAVNSWTPAEMSLAGAVIGMIASPLQHQSSPLQHHLQLHHQSSPTSPSIVSNFTINYLQQMVRLFHSFTS